MKEQRINEFNNFGIADMEEVKEPREAKGNFVNLIFLGKIVFKGSAIGPAFLGEPIAFCLF